MTGMDVAAKWLLDTYSLSQLVFLRCAVSMLVIGLFVLIKGDRRALHTRRPGWHLLRAVMMSLATFSFFYALHLMPLANVVIIAFAAPVIVTALSGPLLGERVGIWRWSAVVVGFIGVIIVVRPAPGLIGSGALFAVFATFMWAGLSLTARKLSTSEPTMALSLYLFPLPMLIGAFGSIDSWVPPTGPAWLLFVTCGTFGGLAFIAINAAFRRAPATVIVPFEYTGLIWAIVAGDAVLAGVARRLDTDRSRRHCLQRPGHPVSRDPNHVPRGGAVGFCDAGCRARGGRPLAGVSVSLQFRCSDGFPL